MSSPFNILQHSPHDLEPQQPPLLPPTFSPPAGTCDTWIPSHYNVRATTEDGRMVLWNTLNGSMSVFEPDQAPTVRDLLRQSGTQDRSAGMAKYLADRGFLILKGTNEQRRVRLAFGESHYRNDVLQLILLASEDCNFRCTYCYEKFAQGTMQPWVRSAIKKLVKKRIDSLGVLQLSWFGGEPLYGMAAIEDLAPYCLDLARERSVEFRSGMTTNGYLLTPEVADKLLAWKINGFQITIDGDAEDHDRTRPTRDGQESFRVIFENLKALSRRRDEYAVTVRINFDRQNHPHLERFLDLLEGELRDDSRFKLHFKAVGRWGGDNDEQLDVCGFDESFQVRRQLEKEALQRGLNIGRGLKDINTPGSQVCYAARPFNFIIGASGKIMKCTIALDTKDYNVVGAIRENGELDLDRDKMALWTEPAFESDGKCQKCTVLPLCHGIHCPMIRFEESRSPCPPLRMQMKQSLVDTSDLLRARSQQARVG